MKSTCQLKLNEFTLQSGGKKKVLREASGWHRPQPEPERVEQQQQQQQQRRDGAREGVTIAGPPSHYRAIGALRTAHGKNKRKK